MIHWGREVEGALSTKMEGVAVAEAMVASMVLSASMMAPALGDIVGEGVASSLETDALDLEEAVFSIDFNN